MSAQANVMPRGPTRQLPVGQALRLTGKTLRQFATKAAEDGTFRRTQKQLILEYKPQGLDQADVDFQHVVATGPRKSTTPFSRHFWQAPGMAERIEQHRRWSCHSLSVETPKMSATISMSRVTIPRGEPHRC